MDSNNSLGQQTSQGSTISPNPQPKSNKWFWMLAGLVIITGAVFFVFNQKQQLRQENLTVQENNAEVNGVVSILENDPLLDKYGKYAYDTYKNNPEILTELKRIDSKFTDNDMGVSFPSKVAVFADGRKMILMEGCFPHACDGSVKVALYEPVNQELYLQTKYGYFQSESNTTIQRFLANYYSENHTAPQATTTSVTIYIKPGTPESKVKVFKTWVEKQSWAASVTYISADQALVDYKIKHKNDLLTLQSLEEMEGNPFGGNITINLADSAQKNSVLNSVNSSEYNPAIEGVIWK
jgi:hypothetical protein